MSLSRENVSLRDAAGYLKGNLPSISETEAKKMLDSVNAMINQAERWAT